MRYMQELKRALKIAFFLALGILAGSGLIPWVMTEDKTLATQRLVGTLWGVCGAFAAAVALLFLNEIIRTKRLAKKAGAGDKGGKAK